MVRTAAPTITGLVNLHVTATVDNLGFGRGKGTGGESKSNGPAFQDARTLNLCETNTALALDQGSMRQRQLAP
ncbi:hypothetical protein K457DRAFT_15392 [Linnemannia elongata AG-77]|uniref:Uncharacterized protein n=1 Tax=Linnemannia elongata AG-77 TaxID=1314771 RepID=A0A197K6Q9_9FUNG|nr:hypothetical protein K457DRAFT_15392 [Linnemannia elongata AG-77]